MKWSILVCFLFGIAFADAVEFVKDGPIHEAFISKEDGTSIHQAVPIQPPVNISEQIPSRRDPQNQWIAGYWSWSRKLGDFIWVTGVWRKAPIGLTWIKGKWEQHEEGFVWLNGFWSPILEVDFEYYSEAAPDLLDEKVPAKPGKDYFWVPGYWKYSESKKDYIWQRGRWNPINENWQYVPAHYEWRDRGYIFVPSYWDWPIDKRGSCYAAANIEPERRATVVYEPSVVLDPLFIIEHLYPNWPSYSCMFYHHYFYHSDIWTAWGAVPPWWHCDLWWSFSWQDMWWIWWWWSHPGFPHPFFLQAEVIERITAPSGFIIKMMEDTRPPLIIAENGVVGSKTLIDAIFTVTGHKAPILPSDPKLVNQIQEIAYPKNPGPSSMRPMGHGLKNDVAKPFFGPPASWLNHAPENVSVPPYPTLPVDQGEKGKVEVAKPKKQPLTYRTPPPHFDPPVSTQPSYPRVQQKRANNFPQFKVNTKAQPYYPTDRTNYYQGSPDIKLPQKPMLKGPPEPVSHSTAAEKRPQISTYRHYDTGNQATNVNDSKRPIQGSPRGPDY